MIPSKVTKLINDSKRIAIMGHANGDADCYGSALGLATTLTAMGKDAKVLAAEAFPDSLDFLLFYYNGEIARDIESVDLLILVDSSDIDRLSDPALAKKLKKSRAKVVLLDHHLPGDLSQFADVAIVNTKTSATSEIIFYLALELGVEIDKNLATCLLAGIVGDTSSFQNQNTNEDSFFVASELMKRGARLKTIVNHLFGDKEVDVLKLWGLAMERLSVNKKYSVASTYLTYENITSYGLSKEAVSGIVNFLNSIKGVAAVMLVTEEEKGLIKVSFRTRNEHVNVAQIARQLGGGGHVKAAGFVFPGSLKELTEGSNHHIVIT